MNSNKFTTSWFINAATSIHGDVYDYSQSVYIDMKTPVCIICPHHGKFLQQPQQHINRRCKCPKCGYERRAKTRRERSKWLPYDQAKQIVRGLGLHNIDEWNSYCKSGRKPANIPASPRITYKNEWEGWEHWIGHNAKTGDFVDFDRAREEVRELHLRSYEEWVHFCRRGEKPNHIPFNPKQVYTDKWKSWGDWLGYQSRSNGNLPGELYIIQYSSTPSNVYKIGRTYRLDKRLYEHHRISNDRISIVATFRVENMRDAELRAHSLALEHGERFAYRRSKEHFRINNIHVLIEAYRQRWEITSTLTF